MWKSTLTASMILGILPLSVGASDWYVDIANCPGGTGTQIDPFCRIQDAISAASNTDTIHIAPGRYFENLTIDKDLRLIGTEGQAATIVDGGGGTASQRVVTIPAARTVNLDGLTLTNGFALEGGGIWVTGGRLSLTNSAVVGNGVGLRGTALGGGIYASGSTLDLRDTIVSANGAFSMNGGADGGGIYASNSTMSLMRCTICGNAAAAPCIPGFSIEFWGGSLVMTNCTVSGNRAGGILAAGAFAMTGSIVCGNDFPGGVEVLGTLIMGASTVCGNDSQGISAASGSIENSIIWGNTMNQINGGPAVGFSDIEGGYLGPNNINSHPLFRATPSGTWTSNGQYDPATFQITLTDTNANWARDELKGAFLDSQFPILSNTATTLTIWADSTTISTGSPIHIGTTYEIHDYRLDPTSPCIDSGDPASAPRGLDLFDSPRYLDGDLDGAMRVDMGAHEFSNVQLAITGNATPGGTLTCSTTGTAGMRIIRFFGTERGEILVDPFGGLFMDLLCPWAIHDHGGVIPNSRLYPIPPISTPAPVYVQDLAIHPSNGSGNTSNFVELRIE